MSGRRARTPRTAATVLLFGLLAPVFAEVPAKPLRIGDVARQLTDQDVAELERVLPAGDKPWLLIGDPSQGRSQFVLAYLSPKTTTPEVRHGSVVAVMRLPNLPIGTSWGSWFVRDPRNAQQGQGESENYAQVAVAGRTFDQMQDDQNMNRPFFVTGPLSDPELISIVAYIRSRPDHPKAPGEKISAGPILAVVRSSDVVTVRIREKVFASQDITLRQQGQGWVIVGILQGQA